MISAIIYPDIVAYTKIIQQELKLNKENYPDCIFQEDDLIVNLYKGFEILFLPIDILHELPIAQCWDDIDRLVLENENIHREINEAIGQKWSRWYARDKKAYLKEYIFKDLERCFRVIEGDKKFEIEQYDLSLDIDYFAEKLIKVMKKSRIYFVIENVKKKRYL